MIEILQSWWAKFSDNLTWLVVLGLVGQAVFMARFVVQWIASEKAGESVMPYAFWWLSLAGAGLLFAYAVAIADPVFIVGQSLGFIIYTRNLMLIRRSGKKARPVGG